MGKVNISELASRHLYFDSNILIYAIERHPDYFHVLDLLLTFVDSAGANASTSELALAECLVKPFAENDIPRQQLFQKAITARPNFDVVPVSRPILIRAAQLRASHKPRLPDAIHLATALELACDTFITNDQLVKPIPGINILQLSDLIP